MFGLLKKLFGTAQSRLLKKYSRLLPLINKFEEQYQSLTEEEVRRKTLEFKERIAKGEPLESLLPEAYAAVKNMCRKLCGTEVHVSGYSQKWDMIPYDVQLLGAIVMFHGGISEMQTGEGKTLTAAMPLYLRALTGKAVHLVTVNDYLAKRDCEWIGTIFRKLGLTTAALTNDVLSFKRKEVYASDIVYGTASEFGFDYLRDNSMASHRNEQCQRGHYFAIVDEIDSILIDEARTPLIISGPVPESRHMYDQLQGPVSELVRQQRDLCNRLATDARRVLETLGLMEDETAPRKLTKEELAKAQQAYKTLWLVNKGTPRNKILKRVKEIPLLRGEIEKWETYFIAEHNKEERHEELAKLLITVDERNNDYELTDQGIQTYGADDFVMFDMGHEYAKIDGDTSKSDADKVQAKLDLREHDSKRKERAHNLRQLLRAHLLMEKDVDYIVHDGKIVIIDENTGRPQPGRRFSDGLHQAIEAKESVAIQGETQTYATVTLQNYFRMYDKLSGMTGTAITEAHEFKEIYSLEALEIPTHRKCQRKDFDDEIYMTEREKYNAILKEIREVHAHGRPILIGTESVEASEKLSRILKQNKLDHAVLNARQHDKEAEIVAEAGKLGAITISTNMAGRGTDIKLKVGVAELGGLHVIGTTRHQSRRIDRQLRGRSGRQGDPGSSKFFISFEDSLMRLFASPRMASLLQRYRTKEGEALSAKILNKSIETAQKRIEQRNYAIRKHTLEYDNVMNLQRKEVYAFRNDLLHSTDTLQIAREILESVYSAASEPPLNKILESFEQKIAIQRSLLGAYRPDMNDPRRLNLLLQEVLRSLMIRKIDARWIEHLLAIDHLRSDVHMRTVGQKDPLLEFKQEAFNLFTSFSQQVREEIARDLFRFEMVPQPTAPLMAMPQQTQV